MVVDDDPAKDNVVFGHRLLNLGILFPRHGIPILTNLRRACSRAILPAHR